VWFVLVMRQSYAGCSLEGKGVLPRSPGRVATCEDLSRHDKNKSRRWHRRARPTPSSPEAKSGRVLMTIETTSFELGLGPAHVEALTDETAVARTGRVVQDGGDRLHVAHGSGELLVVVPRQLETAPVVGDFVLLDDPAAPTARVERVLPRVTSLYRRAAGGGSGTQAIAANVDIVAVLEPLEHAPNVRRIERGITLAHAGGARPCVVLTKADTHDDAAAAVERVRTLVGDVEVLALSATTGDGLEAFRAALPPRHTGVLIGASGAGKSTLVNALMGHEIMKTTAVRGFDKKGRHTTTSRHLFRLPWGAMLIDTPGTRELGLVVDDVALDATFADVANFADNCRYRDCTHEGEPGCAARQAVTDGALSAERLAAYSKQRVEMRSLEERQQATDHEARARGKRFGRMVKDAKRIKGRRD